jgi:hypothetical protein
MKKFLMIALILSKIALLAQESTKESLTELYIATFDRAPDVDGINYWLSSNLSLEGITQSFFEQDETKEKYPDSLSTDEFIDEIYKNLFKRAPDSGGKEYWRSELDSNHIEKSTFILAVTNGAKDDDRVILTNKTEVGSYFMSNNLNDLTQAREVMIDVTKESSSVDDAKRKIDSYTSTACSKLDYGNGKKAFDGTYVKVDSLGNVCINESGSWRAFFPMIIYPANRSDRADYRDYTIGGRFNSMIAYEVAQVESIKEAGMKSLLNTDMYQQTAPLAGGLKSTIQEIKAKGLMDNLLFYYTDYEDIRIDAWSWHDEKKAIITEEDPNGHPNFFINGNSFSNPNSAETIYKNGHQTSDILGTYAYERWDDYQPTGPKRVIQFEVGEQTNPAVIAQINYGVGGSYSADPVGHRFTPIAMASVAHGAKGIAFWKDYGSTNTAVESNSWWDDLPKFNSDIEKMMSANIIQSLHNPFGITCDSHQYTDRHGRVIVLDNIFQKDEWGSYLIPDDDLRVSIGSRLVSGKGYAIISNWHSTTQDFECSVDTKEMGYTFSKLYDFINDKDIGSVNNSTFKVSVPAYSWVVVKFL